jgi:hypothetical protein
MKKMMKNLTGGMFGGKKGKGMKGMMGKLPFLS